jgi:hypothetical protein
MSIYVPMFVKQRDMKMNRGDIVIKECMKHLTLPMQLEKL